MVGAAITLYDLVPVGSVVVGHGYGDPVSLSVGANAGFASTTDPVQPDLGLAGVIGWTQPALAAVDPAVVVPGYGAGTADALPVVVGRGNKPTPQSTCAFLGENRELLIVPVDNNDNQIDAGTDALQYVAESLDGNDVQVTTIAPQNPTTGEIAIPTMASGVNAIVGSYRWSVRNDSTGIVVAYGTHETEEMAVVGDPTPETPDKGICIRIGNQQDGSPIEGATVRVTQDLAGLVQVAAFVTGADGIVDIQVVAAGTYYAHASKAGFALGDPIEFVVA